MKNFFTILKVRTFLSATVLVLLLLFNNAVIATGCYNTTNGYGVYQGATSPNPPDCSGQTITTAPSTSRWDFVPQVGVTYSMQTNQPSGWTTPAITIYYLTGGNWQPLYNFTGTGANTIGPVQASWVASNATFLTNVYNGTGCSTAPGNQLPLWNTNSATLIYKQIAPAAPAIFANPGWTGDHYVCGNFNSTVPTANGATYYRLGQGAQNGGTGWVAWVNGGTTYTAGQTVTVSGSDLPAAGTYKYYMWYAYDACNQQSPAGTSDYVRMDIPPVAGTYAYPALYECDGYTRNASGTIVTNSVSGYTGNPQWYWGSSGGAVNVWGGISASALGNNCFPYQHGSGDADRMWVVLSSGGAACPTVTMSTVLVNPVVPAISNVTAAANPICGQSTTVLTANGVSGLATTTTWYTATGAGGNNLGAGNSVTVGPGQTYYARVTDVCNGTTQCGGTHSAAVEANLLITTETTAPGITAPANISTNNSPNNLGNTAEVFATPGSSDNCGGSAATINVLPLSSNLKCWVKADAGVVKDASGNVAIWKDLSGNGNDFSQPTFTSRPTLVSSVMNGNPVIRMTTTNAGSAAASKWLYTTTNFSSATFTIFSVSAMQGSQNSRLLASASTNWLFGNWGGLQNQLYMNNWISNPATTADTKIHMYEVTSTNSPGYSTSFYDYGTAIVSGSATAVTAPGQLTTSGYLNGSEFSSGDIAEIIVYNTVLTTAQRQIVEGYLAYKYNLQAPLASLQAFQTYSAASNTVNFVATDQSGNKATTTATATKTNYPGPVTTPSTAAAVCNGANITLTTSGMAPAGNYLNCANSGDYLESTTNIPVGSNWTIEAWAKFPLPNTGGAGTWNTLVRGTGFHHIIVERNAVGSSNILGVHNGGFYPCSVNGSLNGNQGFDVTTLSAGWHHVAAVGTGGTTSFYIDGVFVGKSASQCTDNIVAIGNYQGGGQQFGALDEVRIWNTTLAQNTISNNMTQAITASHPNYANMLAYYKMDGNGTDSKAGTYNATLRNAATASTATAFYTYNWSVTGGGTFSPSASGTAETVTATGLVPGNSGNFSVYAAANSVNSATVTTAVSVIADPNVTTHPVSAAFCPGGTYSPFIVAAGGTPSLTYLWKYSTDNSTFNTCTAGVPTGAVYTNTTSANTFSVSGITASGTYYYACFVSATGQDCNTAQSNSGVLTVYPYPVFTTTPTNILCNGASTGSILVNVTVGTSLFDYSKNAGGTYAGSSNQSSPYTFTGLTAGSYDILVRDAHNCVSLPVSTIILTEPSSSPTLTETHTAVLCNGGSTGTITVTASGGTAGYNYSKDGGTNYQVSNVFSGLAQGTYQIKVRDANLCTTANTNVPITQPAVLSFTSSKTDVVCFGDNNGTITLNGSGGVTPYQYSNNNGGSYNSGTDPYTFTGLTPTTYLVGITDANSCPTTFVSVTIDEPAVLSFTTSQVDVLCNGNNTGSITVSATGGTTIYRYSKNNGVSYQLSNVFNGLTAGTYDIVVKDANNCITASQQVIITEPTGVTFTTSQVHVLCNGDNTGSITVNANGGTPGYEYSNDNGTNYQISNVFSTLLADVYPVKVRDANGCATSASNVSITEPTLLTYTTSYANVNCNGVGDGTITINGSGGVQPYNFSINNGSTFQFGPDPFTFNNLPAATYLAGIRDDNGCTKGFTSITIIQPTAITFTTSQVNVLCFGGNNASITISASGGVGGYTYSKDNGTTYQPSNIFTSLYAGNYQIKVKDAGGCITSASSITITQPGTGLTVTASNGNPYSTTVTANLYSTPSGGTPGYTYNWSGPASFATNPAHLLQNPTRTPTTVNMTGTYKVTVTDANGCSASAQTVMNVYDGYVWIGTTSTDWNNNNNWSFQVPDYPDDCTQKAYIQAGTLFSPTVNIPGLTVGAITLVNGAVLNLDHDLTLCSNLVGSTTTIVSNVTGTGKLIMKSTPSVAQTISGKTKFNTTLQIDNSAGVSITAGATQIVNALELKSGVLNVITANLLVFLSNSSSHTAIIDNFSAGMNGSINGAVTMQRRYDAPTSPSYKTEHYMGSPIDQPLYTAFGANGTEGRVINTLCDEKKASSNSPVGNMARFDENWPDAAICNLQGWYIVKTGNTENGRGYSVARTGAGLLTLTGSANQATSYTRTSLTNSGWSNMTIQGHRDTSGWHILSNPWLANLSLSASGGAGMDNQVAVWQTTGPYAGGYRYYQVGFEPVNIAPFQAFLVHKTAVGGLASYTISGSDRVRTPASVYFHSMNNDQELAVNVDNTNGLRDRTVVAFNTQATDNFDAVYDGNKLWGDPDRVSLYSENHNMPMARNTLTSISNNAVVPMGFDAGLPGLFTMSFEGLNSFDATSYIMLEDKQTHVWHNVRNGNYIFNGDTTDNLNRFVLHFTPASVINHTDATCNTLGIIHAEQPGTTNWNYTVENSNAVVVSNGSLNAANPINLNVPVGVYTLTLVDNHNYTVLKQIQVSGLQGVQSSYVASANVVEQNADVTFTSTAVNATGNTWNFGDNNIANGVTVMHSYTAPGVYSATLTSNNADCNNASTQQITVTEKATTGINSVIDKSGIIIWSNDNTVYVDFGKHPKVEAQIEIYNVLGQQLSNDKFDRSSVYHRAFTNLEAAYVIVRVKNNDEIITKKVFITTK